MSKATPNLYDDFANLIVEKMEDTEKAQAIQDMYHAAENGNQELADLFARLIKAEINNIRSTAS